jgi:hypothetical protein
LKEVWGDDAGQFRPERFLDAERQKVNVGVIGNVYASPFELIYIMVLKLSPD